LLKKKKIKEPIALSQVVILKGLIFSEILLSPTQEVICFSCILNVEVFNNFSIKSIGDII